MLLSERNRSFKVTESWRQVPLWLSPLCYVMFALISMVFDRFIFFANAQDKTWSHLSYAYTFRSCQNIYGTLIHCENLSVLKIIEMMFTVQIIKVKSIHYVEMVMFTAQI